MELMLAFLMCLCIALCARVIWGNNKLRLAKYAYDDQHSQDSFDLFQANNRAAAQAYQIDKLEKDRDRIANEFREYRRISSEEWQQMSVMIRENEEIANEAMRVGLETIENMSTEEWYRGYDTGFAAATRNAVFLCEMYPTSKGSTLARRLSK